MLALRKNYFILAFEPNVCDHHDFVELCHKLLGLLLYFGLDPVC